MNHQTIKTALAAAILFSVFGAACTTKTDTSANNNNVSPVNAEQSNANTANISAEAPEGGDEQKAVAPDAVIKDLYKIHGEDFKSNANRILGGKTRTYLDRFFDKSLADSIWKDRTTNEGEIGVLDFDPIYNAQDADIKNLVVAAPKIEGEKAVVTVTFQNFDRKDTLNYQMVNRSNNWKISDIKYSDGSTLAGYFKDAAKEEQTESTENLFAGTYRVGDTTCTVKPIKMAFEVKWAKGSGTMIFTFDGNPKQGDYSFSSEDSPRGRDRFVFDDETYTNGSFIRADGVELAVTKVK